MEKNFLLGVNYWPIRKGVYWWKDFHGKEVREEFSELRGIFARAVRFFLLWEDFQPGPGRVALDLLKALDEVFDAAKRYQLQLIPTLFVGHMSGINWIPLWLLDQESRREKPVSEEVTPPSPFPVYARGSPTEGRVRNFFAEGDLLEHQLFFLRTVVPRYSSHPSLLAWDLGNKPGNLGIPATGEEIQGWIKILTEETERLDPIHEVLLGLHQKDLEELTPFSPELPGKVHGTVCMHGYPFCTCWLSDSLDPCYLPFLLHLAGELSGKGVLMEELGLPVNPSLKQGEGSPFPATESTGGPGQAEEAQKGSAQAAESSTKLLEVSAEYPIFSQREGERFYAAALRGLHEHGAKGALAWCFADFHHSLWDKPPLLQSPHERFFGLFQEDGTLKGTGKAFREFARSCPERRERKRLIKIDMGAYKEDPSQYLQEEFRKFKELVFE